MLTFATKVADAPVVPFHTVVNQVFMDIMDTFPATVTKFTKVPEVAVVNFAY
jgi:hypothetical protein